MMEMLKSDMYEILNKLKSENYSETDAWEKIFEEIKSFYEKAEPVFKISCGRDFSPFRMDGNNVMVLSYEKSCIL